MTRGVRVASYKKKPLTRHAPHAPRRAHEQGMERSRTHSEEKKKGTCTQSNPHPNSTLAAIFHCPHRRVTVLDSAALAELRISEADCGSLPLSGSWLGSSLLNSKHVSKPNTPPEPPPGAVAVPTELSFEATFLLNFLLVFSLDSTSLGTPCFYCC